MSGDKLELMSPMPGFLIACRGELTEKHEVVRVLFSPLTIRKSLLICPPLSLPVQSTHIIDRPVEMQQP